MKIISTKPHKSVSKRVVCRQCGSTLEYVPLDVKTFNTTDIGGGPDGYKYVKCPNCKERVILESW